MIRVYTLHDVNVKFQAKRDADNETTTSMLSVSHTLAQQKDEERKRAESLPVFIVYFLLLRGPFLRERITFKYPKHYNGALLPPMMYDRLLIMKSSYLL